jgi:hypothetical protein
MLPSDDLDPSRERPAAVRKQPPGGVEISDAPTKFAVFRRSGAAVRAGGLATLIARSAILSHFCRASWR